MADEEALRCRLAEMIYGEANCLDQQDWQGWLDHYRDDAVLWAPAWQDEFRLTEDPTSEVSLFYLEGKAMLEDRVWRWSNDASAASQPLPRTSHLIGNIVFETLDADQAVLGSRWQTQVFRRGRTWSYAGAYRHRLRRDGAGWKIAEKYIVVINDLIDTALDLYHV